MLSHAKNNDLKLMTQLCINSLVASEDNIHFNIILIESNKEFKPFQYNHTKTIYPKQKFGYNRYMNIGIEITNSEYVAICNNDLFFHKNWASEIINFFKTDHDLKSASPICSYHHKSFAGILPHTGNYYGYNVRTEISGWCIMLKRDIYDVIGPFDEKFTFWYVDNDYSKLLEKNGIKHALITSSIVDHLESKTLATVDDITKKQITEQARFYFEYKWEGRSYLSYINRRLKFYLKNKKIR